MYDIEIWEREDSGERRLIGTGAITNDGSAGASLCANYDVHLGDRKARVTGFDCRAFNPWKLLLRALLEVFVTGRVVP